MAASLCHHKHRFFFDLQVAASFAATSSISLASFIFFFSFYFFDSSSASLSSFNLLFSLFFFSFFGIFSFVGLLCEDGKVRRNTITQRFSFYYSSFCLFVCMFRIRFFI